MLSRCLFLLHHFIPSTWTFFHFLGHSKHFSASGPLNLFLNPESLGYSNLSLNVIPQKFLLFKALSPVFLYLNTLYCLHSFVTFFKKFLPPSRPDFCQIINSMSSGILFVLFIVYTKHPAQDLVHRKHSVNICRMN